MFQTFGGLQEYIRGESLLRADHTSNDPKVLEVTNNRIYFYSEIDRSSILTLNKSLRDLHSENIAHSRKVGLEKPVHIELHLNSYGGIIFAGLAGMDEIISVSKDVDVITVVDGCCASSATFLSLVGTKRYINRHAYMLIHQLSGVSWGKYEELKDDMVNTEKMMTMIKDIYLKYTKVPRDKLEGILQHDIWFTAEECLNYGLVDEII